MENDTNEFIGKSVHLKNVPTSKGTVGFKDESGQYYVKFEDGSDGMFDLSDLVFDNNFENGGSLESNEEESCGCSHGESKSPFKTYVQWGDIELHSVADRNYLTIGSGENHTAYSLTSHELKQVLQELKDKDINQPMTASAYLKKEALSGRFKKITMKKEGGEIADRNAEIANEIRRQLGNKTMYMLGAYDIFIDGAGLSFKIKGSKTWKHIHIGLNQNDLYDITFTKWKKGDPFTPIRHVVKDVNAESMHSVIEKETGLYTRLEEGGQIYPAIELDEKYNIGMGHLGNGITIWDRNREQDGDYKIIAHIGETGTITYRDKKLSDEIKALIEKEADLVKARHDNELEDGGSLNSIPNNYKGKSVDQVWDAWNYEQRKHFLQDHLSGDLPYKESEIQKIGSKSYNQIYNIIFDDNGKNKIQDGIDYGDLRNALVDHVQRGQYKDGGKLSSSTPEIIITKNKSLPFQDDARRVVHEIEGKYGKYQFWAKTNNSHNFGYGSLDGPYKSNVYYLLLNKVDGNDVEPIAGFDNKWDYRASTPKDREATKKIVAHLHELGEKDTFQVPQFAGGGKFGSLCDSGTEIQTILFDKEKFTVDQAKDWAKKHDFLYGSVETVGEYHHLRQQSPFLFKEESYATTNFEGKLPDGIKAVIGCLKHKTEKMENGGSMYIDSGLVPKGTPSKYELRDKKLYSYVNPTEGFEASHHRVETFDNGIIHKYKLALRTPDGYSKSSNWINEDSLSEVPLTEENRYMENGGSLQRNLADELMEINSSVWTKLKIDSGGQLYDDIELQKKYVKEMNKKLSHIKISPSDYDKIFDILEDENYHSLNQYLELAGFFGEDKKQEWIKYLDKREQDGKEIRGVFLSKDAFENIPSNEDLKQDTEMERTQKLNIALERVDELEKEILKQKKGTKSLRYSPLINEYINLVLEFPEQLYTRYMNFGFKNLQKKEFMLINGKDKDFVQNNLNTNLWNLIPESLRTSPKVKAVSFETLPHNEGIEKIHKPFNEIDNPFGRINLLATSFDKDGVISTDGSVLLFTMRREKGENGLYCFTKKCFSESDGEDQLKVAVFPDYKSIVPSIGGSAPHKIDVNSLLLFTSTLDTVGISKIQENNDVDIATLKFDDFFISFRTELLKKSLIAMKQMGYEDVELYAFSPTKAMVIIPKGNRELMKDYKTDFVLIMPIVAEDPSSGDIYFDVANECVYTVGKGEKVCLNPTEMKTEHLKKGMEEFKKKTVIAKPIKKTHTRKEITDTIDGLKLLLEDSTGKEKQDLEDTINGLELILEDMGDVLEMGGYALVQDDKVLEEVYKN